MRDQRDPTQLGLAYMMLRRDGSSIEDAVKVKVRDYASNEGPIEKYGRPGDAPEVWERIRIR